MKTRQIIEALETKTLLTNETKEIQPEATLINQLLSCLCWIDKWRVNFAVYDNTKYRVKLVDALPDAAPSNKPELK